MKWCCFVFSWLSSFFFSFDDDFDDFDDDDFDDFDDDDDDDDVCFFSLEWTIGMMMSLTYLLAASFKFWTSDAGSFSGVLAVIQIDL